MRHISSTYVFIPGGGTDCKTSSSTKSRGATKCSFPSFTRSFPSLAAPRPVPRSFPRRRGWATREGTRSGFRSEGRQEPTSEAPAAPHWRTATRTFLIFEQKLLPAKKVVSGVFFYFQSLYTQFI